MSGGAWGYLERELEDAAEGARRGGLALELLAGIEHELDWGVSGDTCPRCAEKRVLAALYHYFLDNAFSVEAARAILRDRGQNLCDDDAARRLSVEAATR